jgi:hypothetical protein
MKHSLGSKFRRQWHHSLRVVFSVLPKSLRFALYRSMVDCEPHPDKRLVLKLAETKEELEACFRLLHDAYVGAGYMKPDPSGLRATIYHALPTTTTLCAKFDEKVVGTLSLIRESSFGFPLQSVFDLHEIRARGGRIAEASALAVHPDFRKTSGSIMFPLMKFMHEYCQNFFDTSDLVIAVNPDRIEMYESLLCFERLEQAQVDNYDFANGAPAVGAHLNLRTASATLKKLYGNRTRRKNLYLYFMRTRLKNIVMPSRRYFTTNDPVMTPELLDYFFNERTGTLNKLGQHERLLLHAIYNNESYAKVLPALDQEPSTQTVERKHLRFSIKCPGEFLYPDGGKTVTAQLQVFELSELGFFAYAKQAIPENVWGEAIVQLGEHEKSAVRAKVSRSEYKNERGMYGFMLDSPDLAWRKFVGALQSGTTHEDMSNATQFLGD